MAHGSETRPRGPFLQLKHVFARFHPAAPQGHLPDRLAQFVKHAADQNKEPKGWTGELVHQGAAQAGIFHLANGHRAVCGPH